MFMKLDIFGKGYNEKYVFSIFIFRIRLGDKLSIFNMKTLMILCLLVAAVTCQSGDGVESVEDLIHFIEVSIFSHNDSSR